MLCRDNLSIKNIKIRTFVDNIVKSFYFPHRSGILFTKIRYKHARLNILTHLALYYNYNPHLPYRFYWTSISHLGIDISKITNVEQKEICLILNCCMALNCHYKSFKRKWIRKKNQYSIRNNLLGKYAWFLTRDKNR